VCEQRPPIGNLRENTFMELWTAHDTDQIRKSIKARECYCTNEIFMWPSIVFQPLHLAKSMLGAKVWKEIQPLDPSTRVDYEESAACMEIPRKKLRESYELESITITSGIDSA
jgi:hypothetical protein